MTKFLLSCLVAVVGVTWSAPALASTLDELPECPGGTPDEMTVTSPRATLVVGRANAFRAQFEGASGLLPEPWRFSAEIDGQPVGISNATDRRFELTPSHTGRLSVSVTYGLESRYDFDQRTTLPPCRMVATAFWRVVRLKRFPRLDVLDYGEKVEFSLEAIPRRECFETYERTPIAVRVRQRGGRRMVATAHANDPCRGFDSWTEWNARTPWWRTFYFEGFDLAGPRRSLKLSLQWPEKASRTWAFDYTVRVGKRTVQRGVIRVRTTYHPAERVYAWLPGGRVNDDYWNICVRNARPIAMHNGNAYCNVGGYSERSLIVRRR